MSKLALVAGAGGFIGGHLARRLLDEGYRVRAVDKKPLEDWYQVHKGVESLRLDLSHETNCHYAMRDVADVYQLAADMGGMGFIERYRIECMRSVLINVYMLAAAAEANVARYFFSSSACAYNINLQRAHDAAGLKEEDAYPAMPERGYGWEKLYSELMAQEYFAERGLPTFIARLHNVYGPNGTWRGGREKAPAALCRKVAETQQRGESTIEVWGDGSQIRTYMYIDDCVEGIRRIVEEPKLAAVPINLGSEERVSVNGMLDVIEFISGAPRDRAQYHRQYDLDAPKGVTARASDNTFIREALNWEPSTKFVDGIKPTYYWIYEQVERYRSGKKVVW